MIYFSNSLRLTGGMLLSIALPGLAGDDPGGKNPVLPSSKAVVDSKAVVAEEITTESNPFWRFSAGVAVRSFGDVNFRSGSDATRSRIPSFVGGDSARGSNAGPVSGFGDRRYADGFVLFGPSVQLTGLTQNYGFASNAQIIGTPDAATGLRFHSDGGGRRETSSSLDTFITSGHDDLGDEAGAHLQLDRLFPLREGVNIGASIGFDFFGIDGSHSSRTLTGLQSAQTFSVSNVDTFAFPGVVVAPTAPFNFPESTIGDGGIPTNPLLSNVPIGRSVTTSKTGTPEVTVIGNRVNQDLDIDLYTLSFGVTAELERARWFAAMTTGLTVNIADTNWRTTETLFANGRAFDKQTKNQDDQEIVVGFYAQGSLGIKVAERTSISGFVRYDAGDGIEGSNGPHHYDFDLDGWSAGLAVGIEF